METTRSPQAVRGAEQDEAPGSLDLVRGFMALHHHEPGNPSSLAPSADTMAWWLRDRGLVGADDQLSRADLDWALGIRDALVTMVRRSMGANPDPVAIAVLNEAARETGLRPRFGDVRLEPEAGGVRGAVGRMLAVAFLAELDGSWERFRLCADPECQAVFYDRSKNRSGRWCSMQTCGNRNKVRAFRERHTERA